MYNYEEKNLIIVYKDELLLNQLKKLIETDDDNEEFVGTIDDSIKIISWDEKTWMHNKKAGNINDKVLFLGSIKGTEKLTPVVDIKFNKYGVKYGWAGNQFILWIDQSELKVEEKYKEFINEISNMPIPENYKNVISKPIILNNNNPSTNAFQKFISEASSLVVNTGISIFNSSKDKKNKEMQMYLYGIINLYLNHLQKFMEA